MQLTTVMSMVFVLPFDAQGSVLPSAQQTTYHFSENCCTILFFFILRKFHLWWRLLGTRTPRYISVIENVHTTRCISLHLRQPPSMNLNISHKTQSTPQGNIRIHIKVGHVLTRVLRCENANASTLRASERERVQSCQ